jgi:hypothetical protein
MSNRETFTMHTSRKVSVVSGTILYDDVEVDDVLTAAEVEFVEPPPVQRAIRLLRVAPRTTTAPMPTLRDRLRKLAPGGMVLMPRRRRAIAAS